MSHADATLTPTGRLRLARLVVDRGWTYARAAERFSVSVGTACRWALRYRAMGPEGMGDRSSRPHNPVGWIAGSNAASSACAWLVAGVRPGSPSTWA